jgi:hypothetical protein
MCTYQLRRRRRLINRNRRHCYQLDEPALPDQALAQLLLDPEFVAQLRNLIGLLLAETLLAQMPRYKKEVPATSARSAMNANHRPMRRPGH